MAHFLVLPLVTLIMQEVIELKLLDTMDEDEMSKVFEKYTRTRTTPDENGLYDISGLNEVLKNCPFLKGDWLSSFFDLVNIRNELLHNASQWASKKEYSNFLHTIHELFSQVQKLVVYSIWSNPSATVSKRCNNIKNLLLKFDRTSLRRQSKFKYYAFKIKRKVLRET